MRFIESCIDLRGFPPSTSEVASRLDISIPTARQHMLALESKGWIERTGQARGITVLRRLPPF